MAITYTWKITRMYVHEINGLSDAVIHACFSVLGVDENSKQGVVESDIKLGAPNLETFIQISNVKESDVISWVKSALGDDGKGYEARVAEQISRQQTPQPKTYQGSWMESEAETV